MDTGISWPITIDTEPTYTDPDNPGRLLGQSEVERRQLYFDQLVHVLAVIVYICMQIKVTFRVGHVTLYVLQCYCLDL